MIEQFMSNLVTHVLRAKYKDPILITFASKYPARLRGKFMLLKRWKAFILRMQTELPYREYNFRPIAWAMEYSENAVHIHCVARLRISSRVLNHAWVSLNRHDLGKVDIRPLDAFEQGFRYAFKGYLKNSQKLDKFIGHYEMIIPKGIYN